MHKNQHASTKMTGNLYATHRADFSAQCDPEAIGGSFFRAIRCSLEAPVTKVAKCAGRQSWCRLRSGTPEQDSLMWHVSDCIYGHTMDSYLLGASLCSLHVAGLASHTPHATWASPVPFLWPGWYNPPRSSVFWPFKFLWQLGILSYMEIQDGQLPNFIFLSKSHWISLFMPIIPLKNKKERVCWEIKTCLNKHHENYLGLGIWSVTVIREIQTKLGLNTVSR